MERPLSLSARRELIERQRPAYQTADSLTKRAIVEEIATFTGYHRVYARRLLNHPETAHLAEKRSRPRQYGPEVQHVLFLAWHAANRICPKRLTPYLPTWLEVLERQGHLQITPACRAQLLAMSASTAERILRSQRLCGLHGLSTTKAGTLLRQQIPIRTWARWNDTQPGFLEGDLVAHSCPGLEGAFLFTLALTDVATGWTECMPVTSKGQEVVLAAFQQARLLFPFPILGLDVDCGGEFLNEAMVEYCTQEQIMLTRGRPAMKNDQCFVEAQNRHRVRQVVGHDRYCGEYACRQMAELYRTFRLYSNCFQPLMKRIAHEEQADPVRRRYDPTKTPLQRLLLSGVLSPAKEQELTTIVQALDPVRLLHQLRELQVALFRCAVNASPFAQHQPVTPIQVFVWERCLDPSLPSSLLPSPASLSHTLSELLGEHLLSWKWYRTNPFVGEWDYIASCLRECPDLTTPTLFQRLQSRARESPAERTHSWRCSCAGDALIPGFGFSGGPG